MAFSFLFPGQGSQYTGMFEKHFEEFEEFQKNLSIAEEFYKEDLKSIISKHLRKLLVFQCFWGPEASQEDYKKAPKELQKLKKKIQK